MPLVVLHLRWDQVGPEQYQRVCAALPGDPLPAGCLSRQLRHTGRVLLGTDVWDSQSSALAFLDGLPVALRPAGLRPPQVVSLQVPAVLAAGYVRQARPPLPRPRQVTTQEVLTGAGRPG